MNTEFTEVSERAPNASLLRPRPGKLIAAFGVLTSGFSLLTFNLTPAASAQRPQFRSGVDLVQVDVSVLDAARRPVRGLSADDFTVLEDGVPQTVVAFNEISAPDPVEPTAPWMKDVTPDVRTNTAEDGRLLVFVLDDAMAKSGLQSEAINATIRTVGAAFVDRMGPADLAAVIFTLDARSNQDFTNDRGRLRDALGRFEPKYFPFVWPELSSSATYFPKYTHATLEKVVEHLTSVTGRRKALIFVSDSVHANMSRSPYEGPMRLTSAQALVLQRAIGVLEDAQRANITVYSVNPRAVTGLRELPEMPLDDPDGAERRARAFDRPNPSQSFFHQLARVTGGFSITQPTDFVAGVTQVLRETGSYYLLGYQSSSTRATDQFRELEVVVNRPDLLVRAREGYFPRPQERPAATKGSPPSGAAVANAGLLPATDLPLRVTVTPLAIPGKRDTALTIVVGLRRPAPDTPLTEDVTLLVQAFTPTGDRRGARSVRSQVALVPSEREARYEIQARIDLAPGRYELRIAAESHTQAKSGSVFYGVDVPDFSKGALSLSGVLIGAAPPLPVGRSAEVAALAPVQATSQREFAGHRGTAFLRVYQGGGRSLVPVTMRVRIVNARNETMLDESEVIAVERFGSTRAADYSFDLPVTLLSAGDYVVMFDATAGPGTADRRVPFSVR